jgi:hypothetical protein
MLTDLLAISLNALVIHSGPSVGYGCDLALRSRKGLDGVIP